jgi:hypothetical protein
MWDSQIRSVPCSSFRRALLPSPSFLADGISVQARLEDAGRDCKCLEQATDLTESQNEPVSQGQARIAGYLDGGDQDGRRV